MSLSDSLTNGLIQPSAPDKTEGKDKDKNTPKLPKKLEVAKGYAPPGGAEAGKRKPLPRGEPFENKNTLTKWSTR